MNAALPVRNRLLAALVILSILAGHPARALAACATPTGAEGEFFYNQDFKVIEYCDGTNWVGMYGGASGGGSGSLSDGNKGDVTVSGSGATWTINAASVQYSKIQNVTSGALLGRYAATGGSVQEITLGSGLSLNTSTGVLSATGSLSGSGAAGYVPYWSSSTALAYDNTTNGQFFWDATNHRLGIGLAAPTQALDVYGKITSNAVIIKPVAGAAVPSNGAGGLWASDGTNVWRATGKVGIGTSAPTNRLVVGDDIGATSIPNTAAAIGGATSSSGLAIGQANTARLSLAWIYNATPANAYALLTTVGTQPVVLQNNGGNVGIGTTTPNSALQVNGTITLAGGGELMRAGYWNGSGWVYTDTGVPPFVIRKAATNITEFRVMPEGTAGAAISGTAYSALAFNHTTGAVGIGNTNPAARLDIALGGANGALAVRGDSTVNWQAASIYSNDTGAGGHTWAFGSRTGVGYSISDETAGQIRVAIDNSGSLIAYGAAYKPGGGSWTATSDARLKDIDGPYERGLEAVDHLNTIRFHYKKDNPRHEPSDRPFVGMVAQDVQKVFPEAVSKGADGYLSLDTTPINYAMINAIKELKADNDSLRAEFEAYKKTHP